MNVRIVRALVGGATLVASGAYLFVYLYRWEWNRALVSGVIFIAAEVALIGWLLADRLRNLDRRLEAVTVERDTRVLQHLRETAPPARVSFAWLGRPDQLNVFVPVLMGAGVVLSGLAWVVERLARTTARPVAEKNLAARLTTLSLPAGGFVPRNPAPHQLDLLRGPGRPVAS